MTFPKRRRRGNFCWAEKPPRLRLSGAVGESSGPAQLSLFGTSALGLVTNHSRQNQHPGAVSLGAVVVVFGTCSSLVGSSREEDHKRTIVPGAKSRLAVSIEHDLARLGRPRGKRLL